MSDAHPLVDVVVPTVGRLAYLREAVGSVQRQTFTRWRLVVSDNGSNSDEVRAFAEQISADPRVEFRSSPERVSVTAHLTRLLTDGNARYVAILPDDDLWQPGFLERRVRFLEEQPTCGFVFSSMTVVDGSGAEVKRWRVRLDEGVQDRRDFIRRLLAQNVVGLASALIRRSTLERVGPWLDDRYPRTADYELWLRLAIAAPVGFLDSFDAALREHPDQGTGEFGALEEEYAGLASHAWELVNEQAPELRLSPRWKRRRVASLLLTGVLNAIERDDRDAALHYLRRAMQVDPWSAFDRRTPFAVAGVVFGDMGRSAVRRARAVAHTHGIGLRL